MKHTKRIVCLGVNPLALILLAACTESGQSESQNLQSSASLVGKWQGEDQLVVLDSIDGEPIDVIVGFDLNVPSEIATAEEKLGKTIKNWMIMRTTREFTASSHSINSQCETLNKDSVKLHVTAPIVLDESNTTYTLPEDERTELAALGGFQCFAEIPGKATRRYKLSSDGQTMTLILGDSPADQIPLKRIR